ncbi:hypothetical protein HMPREF1548_06798 [Clostridium sp. KLE 1755]|nr:hypothetical protein HMPREF1548_06798 [Clostridium sp. KLE 1755]
MRLEQETSPSKQPAGRRPAGNREDGNGPEAPFHSRSVSSY